MDDVNELIYLANQIGLIDKVIQSKTPNASKCLTRSAVEETNNNQSEKMGILKIEDIYGMLVLQSIGLGGALLVLLVECIVKKIFYKKEERNQ